MATPAESAQLKDDADEDNACVRESEGRTTPKQGMAARRRPDPVAENVVDERRLIKDIQVVCRDSPKSLIDEAGVGTFSFVQFPPPPPPPALPFSFSTGSPKVATIMASPPYRNDLTQHGGAFRHCDLNGSVWLREDPAL
ncbi:hypothetical protein GALMADRAFT_134650 [Galerina marginata CBS 339.88]|uniref:Uncharacterized protein n=1 Tax=Galerina marginata (strain CBS 339.88) TaxID=685588 RepID=A0A067TIV2_GALM3|nr:hypothetical protein GALMADRAFT_134650 [Galerina marginata CBS 339.88]